MWQDFKLEWVKSNFLEKIILLLFYPLGFIIGLLIAIIWNTYGAVILVGIGIILIDDTIPSGEIVTTAGSLVLLFKLIKFLFGKKE